jgi:hypothetical protein
MRFEIVCLEIEALEPYLAAFLLFNVSLLKSHISRLIFMGYSGIYVFATRSPTAGYSLHNQL